LLLGASFLVGIQIGLIFEAVQHFHVEFARVPIN